MLRRLLTTAGVAGVVAFVVGGGAFAVASSSSGTDGPARTITVIEKSGSQQFVDVGKHGFSTGDEFTFNSVFWNVGQTRRVGSNHGYCIVLKGELVHCVGSGRLAGGTIEFAGNVPGQKSDFRIAVTGGTGSFQGAEGQVVIHNLNNAGTLSRDVIELIG
jgi:hypothetical protein